VGGWAVIYWACMPTGFYKVVEKGVSPQKFSDENKPHNRHRPSIHDSAKKAQEAAAAVKSMRDSLN